VELLAAVDNAASQRVALAAGFQHEGVRRGGEVLRDGSRGDLAAFARLAADPGERITPYLPFPPDGGLCDGTVRLTPMTAEDAADYHRLMADPEVIRFNVPPEPPDAAELLRRCRHTAIWWLTGQRAELAVRDAASGAFAGHVQLTHVAPPIGQAMTGYALLPEHRGRGFATRAVRLLVDWAFAHTPLARVVAGTDPENTASHRVLERAGFTKEALLRGLLPGPDGTRRDDLQWVRLRG
jgi:RimJ/RimL family protein N-acetyltransferase